MSNTPGEQRLAEVARQWQGRRRVFTAGADGLSRGSGAPLIEAAVQALVDGLDSPSLCELAAARPDADCDQLERLLASAMQELGIAKLSDLPGDLEQIELAVARESREPTDAIRFEIVLADESVGGHEVRIFANEVELTELGAGMGMSPFDLLIPHNQLIADAEDHRVGIARCDCGVYGCGGTDVVIVRDGDTVHWDWSSEQRGLSFPAKAYDAEVARIAADHSWERPEDTAARLVLTGVDTETLASRELSLSWAGRWQRGTDDFVLALMNGSTQILLHVAMAQKSPEQIAEELLSIFAQPPETWSAGYLNGRPEMAGPGWFVQPI